MKWINCDENWVKVILHLIITNSSINNSRDHKKKILHNDCKIMFMLCKNNRLIDDSTDDSY